MKFFSIGLVLIVLVGAFYVNDRIVVQRKTLHLADSLDSINKSIMQYSVDSLMKASDNDFYRRITRLKKHMDFQDRVILRLQKRLDSLIHSEHGR